MRQHKALGLLFVLTGLAGCAQVISGDTQEVTVQTEPRDGAKCTVQNERGSWGVLSTPATVTLLRSTSDLSVACATDDGWTGSVTRRSHMGALAYVDLTVAGLGTAVDSMSGAAYNYPDLVNVVLDGPTADTSPTFGLDGGKNIPTPLAPTQPPATQLGASQPAPSPVVQAAVETPARPMMAQPVSMPTAPPPEVNSEFERMNDDNIAIRFQTLRVLLDEGLVTRDEYNNRRGANLGALLRYSLVPGARDLTRSAPPPRTLVARLRYLASAYAEHSISASEQAAERSVILDGLLPYPVARRADPPPPITDEMRLGAEIGRIERLHVANVITDAESAKEKAKVAQLLDASIAASDAAARAAAGMAAARAAMAQINTGVGIGLSVYNSESQARHGWSGLQKAHPAELGQLSLSLKKIPRPHRPTHYQIVAGPVADHDTAIGLCKSLRKSDVPCDAAVYGE